MSRKRTLFGAPEAAAHAKLLAIVLAERQPKDLLTGQFIDTGSALAWSNAKEFHHFFPRKFLESKGESANRINSLANFVILSSASNKSISDSTPSDYLKQVAAALGKDLDEVLAANLISKEAFEAATRDDYSEFLHLRAETIQAAVAARADWNDAGTTSASTVATDEIVEDDDDVI